MQSQGVSFAGRIEDEFRFLRTWVANPLKTGAVSPSSRALARLMVETARLDQASYTLELGPGTGVATQAIVDAGIAPERIVAVEREPRFCRLLRKRFPSINVVEGDAFDLDASLAEFGEMRFCAVISGLPLLSFPKARRLACVEGALARVRPGGPFVQFSYGFSNPLDPVPAGLAVKKSKWVVLNLPPARAWTYSRSAEGNPFTKAEGNPLPQGEGVAAGDG